MTEYIESSLLRQIQKFIGLGERTLSARNMKKMFKVCIIPGYSLYCDWYFLFTQLSSIKHAITDETQCFFLVNRSQAY